MKILVTGAKGFVGKNLVSALEGIRDGKDKVHRFNGIGLEKTECLEIIPCGREFTDMQMENACRDCSFVFHFAGVNRPNEQPEFMEGNYCTTKKLLGYLKKYNPKCPVMLASSIQASLIGAYEGSEYGKSKLAAEGLVFSYTEETGAEVYVYRFPNLFGKWCRPNYNSVVATFCYNLARGLPIQVNGFETELQLVYIDDLIDEMRCALNGKAHRCGYDGLVAKAQDGGRFCFVPVAYKKTLGEIAGLLEQFKKLPQTAQMPQMPCQSFEKKLYTTYLSYLPPEKMRFPLNVNTDSRGSFIELMRTAGCGQFSVNISKPGVTKGQHWHHSKWEYFVVVAGHGLIQERQVGVDGAGNPYPILEFEVSGEKMEVVYMLPGYVHNIINLSDCEDLITFVWANEPFDQADPDTYSELV